MQSIPKKVKRTRLTEIKKWSYEETCKILDYILQTGKLEKPTAQLYYRKLIDETGIDATWTMVRWKMRNLKTSFSKCNEWRKSTGAGLVEGEDRLATVHDKILKMSPHYDRLQEIFGEKRSALEVRAYESTNYNAVDESEESFLNETLCESYAMDSNEQPHTSTHGITLCESYAMDSNEQPHTSTQGITVASSETVTESLIVPGEITVDLTTKSSSMLKEKSRFAEKLKRSAPKTSIQKLSGLHSERNQLNNKKIELEQKKFDNEVERDEKRHKLETLKIELEEKKLKWDKEKFQSEQEFKLLQLEKEERIAMFEIEMKYKNTQ